MDIIDFSTLLIPIMLLLIFLAILRCCRSRKDSYTVKGKDIGRDDQAGSEKPTGGDDDQVRDLQKNLEHCIDLKFNQLKKEILKLLKHPDGDNDDTPDIPEGQDRFDGSEVVLEHLPDRYVEEKEVESDPDLSPLVKTCVDIYNRAIKNSEEERQFRKEYRPERIDIPNAMSRLKDLNLEPLFVSADNGDLFVCELKEEDSISYAVFPRFGLIISSGNYSPGAIGMIFKCPEYNPLYNFNIRSVVRPAFFQRGHGNYWNFIIQGELSLISEDYRKT